MTALPIPTEAMRAAEPAPRLDEQWVPISEAARALDVSEGRLRRRCAEQLGPADLARQGRRADGVTCWHLHRKADRRLLPGRVGEQHRTPDLDQFTADQVRVARRRAACVEALREARERWQGDQAKWLPVLVQRLREQHKGLKISERSLRRWYGLYRVPADLPKLIDQRGGNQRGEADPSAWEYFRSIYLDPRQPSTKNCWRRTKDWARAGGLRWCSYEQCRRKLEERIPPDVQAQFRDPRKYRNAFEPFIEQDPERHAAGTCWIGDHAQLDLWCRFGQKLIRPWLTAWMDWRTRRVMGWTLSDSPNSTTILAALRVGLTDPGNVAGLPDVVWIDNGKDYDAFVFHGQTKEQRKRRITDRVRLDETQAEGIFGMLRIEAHFSLPYNPRGKGRLERWFKTVHGRFDQSFPTYAGSSPESRPEELKAVLAKPHMVPTFEHVQSRLEEFIAGYNADAEHAREDMAGLSPDEAMVQWHKRHRRLADPKALDLLLQHWHQPVRVHRNGLTIRPRGKAIRYGQFEHAIKRLAGTKRKVRVAYDPADLRTVRVYDEQFRYLCTAAMNGSGGQSGHAITVEHVGELIRKQRQYRASKRDMRKHYEHEFLTGEELLAGEARQAAKPTADAPLQVVRTPVDDQGDDVARGEGRARRQRQETQAEPIDLADFAGPPPAEVETANDQGDALDIFRDLLSSDDLAQLQKRNEPDDDGFDLLGPASYDRLVQPLREGGAA